MSEIITAPLHTAYHFLGYHLPVALRKVLLSAPIAVLEKAVGKNEGILREDDWILIAARYDAAKRRGAPTAEGSTVPGIGEGAQTTRRYTDGSTFSPLDFFGFEYNKDPILREQCFSNERYPYPMYGGHFHTIMGSMRRQVPYSRMGYVREEIKSGYDGCDLVLEWRLCEAKAKGVVAVVPGLSSTCMSSYIQRFVQNVVRSGYHVVVLETRGVAHKLAPNCTVSCGTFTHDLEHIFDRHLTPEYLENRFGEKDMKLMAVGFSMGGTLLCRHLSQVRENSRLHCAIACQSPFDFHDSVVELHKPFQLIAYQPALLQGLEKVVAQQGDLLLALDNASSEFKSNVREFMAAAAKGKRLCSTTTEYDARIVCPAHGYKTTGEYYTAATSLNNLHKVEIPLMCFASTDDPITGAPPSLRRWDFVCDANPNLLFVRSPTGGHLGFVRGPLDELLGRPSYVEERLVKALDAAVNQARPTPVRRDVPDKIEYYRICTERK